MTSLGALSGDSPVSGWSKVKVRLDRVCGMPGWVFHDLRRTLATGMADLDGPPHVTEKIINHRGAETTGPVGRPISGTTTFRSGPTP
jgi:integrase